ncbi:MAG: PAS domain S-box protein [Desulfomonile tiedjei]|nr:PAS domain S-box protein [Desulfomonile tiedjei]
MKKGLKTSEAVLAGILILLALTAAAVLFRLYTTSQLLAESDKRTFILETKNKAVILEDYFRRRMKEAHTFCGLNVFQTYFDGRTLGLGAGQGLDVLSSQIEQELLVKRLDIEEQGRPVYVSAAFFDLDVGKVLARTDFSPKGKWINETLFTSLRKTIRKSVELRTVCEGSFCRAFVAGVVRHRDKAKGLLLLELATETFAGEVQLLSLQRIDDFTGLADSEGTLFMGPASLTGRTIRDIFGIPPQALQAVGGGSIEAHLTTGPREPLTIAQRGILDTGFHIIHVTPASKFAGGHSPVLWTMVLVSLMGALVLMLIHLSRTGAERNRMYQELRDAHDGLEARVKERTSELKLLNETLLVEVQERSRAEEALRKAREGLELRVDERTRELLVANQQLQQEVEQRKKAEEALRESEERFRGLTETTSEWIWEMDLNCRFTYASPRLMELLGYTPEEIVGRPLFDLMPPDEADRVRGELETIVSSARPFKALENLNLHKDGRVIMLETSGLPFFDAAGHICGYRGIGRDITDRKRAEDLLIQSERLKAVAELSAGVAHNFNNLLQVVLSNAEIASKAADSQDMQLLRSNLGQIMDGCRFGAETVKRLENFASGRSQVTVAEGKVFSLSNTVQKAIEMTETWWKTAPEREGLTIHLTRQLDDDCFVQGEEHEMFEVVVNLIKNSAEALPHGGQIAVAVLRRRDATVLHVEDNGVGISEKNLGRLFQPFFTTKGFHGTGMGLASSYGIVARHGGSISVDSKEGKGTKFTIYLPSARVVEKPSPLVIAGPPRALRILVVDDQALVAAGLEALFQHQGHTVFKALSGQEGLDIFLTEQMDVVISDLSMPSMTGWQFAQAVKDTCKAKHLPKPLFVILTGWGSEVLAEHSLEELGVDYVLQKPVSFRKLVATVHEWVQTRRSSDSALNAERTFTAG